MLNFYYLYGIIWTFVIILYSFGWSDFNKSLDPALLVFFFVTVCFSFFMGYLRRKKFIYFPCKIDYHKRTVTKCLLIGFILDFIYSKQIPLISIILGKSTYMDFKGIPILHVFLISAGAVYCFSLFYKFLNINNNSIKRKVFVDFFLIVLMYLLMFSRQMVAIIIIGCILLLYSDFKYKNKMSNLKNRYLFLFLFLFLFLVLFLFLFLFGVLGNLRSGYSWNDCSLIEKIGRFNSTYPVFLPKEFMWAYIYITNPLANLSHALITGASSTRNILYALIPEFIAKRIGGGNLDFWSTGERFNLVAEYFNATTCFADAAVSARYTGLIIHFLTMVIYCEFVIHANKKSKNSVISLIVADIVVGFSFFFNTLSYSGISLQLLIIAMMGFFKNKKIKFK